MSINNIEITRDENLRDSLSQHPFHLERPASFNISHKPAYVSQLGICSKIHGEAWGVAYGKGEPQHVSIAYSTSIK